MDSETQSVGPLTLLRAGDWVAEKKKPRSRWFLSDSHISETSLGSIRSFTITKADATAHDFIDELHFARGDWIVVEPNIALDATILGAYNKPEGK